MTMDVTSPVTKPGGAGTRQHRTIGAACVCVALLGGCRQPAKHTAAFPPRTATAATIPATTTTTAPLPPIQYTVKQGDTFDAIAGRYHIPANALAAFNHLANPNKLTPGHVVLIPAPPPPPRTTTTTAPPPAELVITPASGAVGSVFNLNLSRARPRDYITFTIHEPGGHTFVGVAHRPNPDGTISTYFRTTQENPPGLYTVIATGVLGTSASADFLVTPTASTAPTATASS
jgi:LysM repeat protein